jgi:hypothetical protein
MKDQLGVRAARRTPTITSKRDELVKVLGRVSQWRNIARLLDLRQDRISWLGPVEKVALRVLHEAHFQGKLDDVSPAAERVAEVEDAPDVVTVTALSVEKSKRAVMAVAKLAEVVEVAAGTQPMLFDDRFAGVVRARIEACRSLLAETEALLPPGPRRDVA